MSKERAKRRAEREAIAAEEKRAREAKARRAAARASAAGTVAAPVTRSRAAASRWHRRAYPPGDPFARRRRRQNLVIAALFVGVQVLTWWLTPSWGLRLGVLGLSLLLAPVVRLLLFDRR